MAQAIETPGQIPTTESQPFPPRILSYKPSTSLSRAVPCLRSGSTSTAFQVGNVFYEAPSAREILSEASICVGKTIVGPVTSSVCRACRACVAASHNIHPRHVKTEYRSHQ